MWERRQSDQQFEGVKHLQNWLNVLDPIKPSKILFIVDDKEDVPSFFCL